jgi:RNA polymerase sigma factor (sigma-70 family)
MSGSDRGRFLRLVRDEPGLPERPDPFAVLADAAAAGDPRAVRTFLVTVAPHVLRTLRRVLGTHHPDLDDVAQECALNVIDALRRRRGESRVLYFVCRVATLTAMNVRRRDARLKRSSEREDAASVDLLAIEGHSPDERLFAEASANIVRELLDSLPMEQAEVLALHCVLGYTVPEIAESHDVPAETLRSRLRAAKRALRERLLDDPRFPELVGESS